MSISSAVCHCLLPDFDKNLRLMSGRGVFRSIFWILVAVVFFAHVFGGWAYSNRIIDDVFTPSPGEVEVPDGDYALSEVTYRSPLGAMDAWYLPSPGTTWVIHVHGLNATPGESERLFQTLQEAGYPQLAIAYRNDVNQPADPSGFHQYGATEWEDISGAVTFARDNGAREIVFVGYSTGASHVLSYVFRHNFDDIAGVIVDSANIDLGSTVDFRGSQENLPVIPINVPPTMAWVAKFFTSLRIDVNWRSLDYVDKAERSLRVPVLAIHGTEDKSAPISQSIALEEAKPELVDLLRVDGAGHVGSLDTDFNGYTAAVLAFLQNLS
jgi:pimeloyl-ACP methyl ester carboxylesterase